MFEAGIAPLTGLGKGKLRPEPVKCGRREWLTATERATALLRPDRGTPLLLSPAASAATLNAAKIAAIAFYTAPSLTREEARRCAALARDRFRAVSDQVA